jgi:arylsulfatase B
MTLLPAKMKLAGYKTAMTGKWHCGARSEANLPINRGFDSHFGFLKGGENHMTQCLSDPGPPAWSGPDLWRNHAPAVGENGTFSTLLYAYVLTHRLRLRCRCRCRGLLMRMSMIIRMRMLSQS